MLKSLSGKGKALWPILVCLRRVQDKIWLAAFDDYVYANAKTGSSLFILGAPKINKIWFCAMDTRKCMWQHRSVPLRADCIGTREVTSSGGQGQRSSESIEILPPSLSPSLPLSLAAHYL